MPSAAKILPKNQELALTRLEARIGLVDNIDPALAADQLVIAVALGQRLQRIANFHGSIHKKWGLKAP